MREGSYHPGPERIVEIKKSSGGTRPLVLLNIADRVVQRAVVIILQPLLNALFDANSFGYRPRRASARPRVGEYLTVSQGRRVWIIQDIKDAFGHVPVSRLLQVVSKILPDDGLLQLLERILTAQRIKGLPQGGPLSPLMLNTYLNHFLDRPWRREQPTLPLVRVADDLLLPCVNKKQAIKAHEFLSHLLLPAGMPLKFNFEDALHDLAGRRGGDLAGLQPQQGQGWPRSRNCHQVLGPAGGVHWPWQTPRAIHPSGQSMSSQRWLRFSVAPAIPGPTVKRLRLKIIECAHQQGFEEVPKPLELLNSWQRAYCAGASGA